VVVQFTYPVFRETGQSGDLRSLAANPEPTRISGEQEMADASKPTNQRKAARRSSGTGMGACADSGPADPTRATEPGIISLAEHLRRRISSIALERRRKIHQEKTAPSVEHHAREMYFRTIVDEHLIEEMKKSA